MFHSRWSTKLPMVENCQSTISTRKPSSAVRTEFCFPVSQFFSRKRDRHRRTRRLRVRREAYLHPSTVYSDPSSSAIQEHQLLSSRRGTYSRRAELLRRSQRPLFVLQSRDELLRSWRRSPRSRNLRQRHWNRLWRKSKFQRMNLNAQFNSRFQSTDLSTNTRMMPTVQPATEPALAEALAELAAALEPALATFGTMEPPKVKICEKYF